MQKQKHSLASKLLLGLTVLFFYLPIIYIVVFSFNDSLLPHPLQRLLPPVV